MGYKLAIDFGMTNSVIAQWDEASASGQTLAVPPLSAFTSTGAFMIPTLLYVQNGQTGEIVVGAEVGAQSLDRQMDNRLFRNFKRTLKADAVFDARLIDGAPWTEAQAGKLFLQRLLEALPYRAEEIDQLAVTVPVAAFEEYTSWLSQAVVGIPIEKIRVVDESTAAALGYAVTAPGAIVLVIDFGGGTLDLSLVRLPESHTTAGRILHQANIASSGNAQVIAKAGLSLGGSDIDQWLLQDVLRRELLSYDSVGEGYASLLSACEQAKITLSTAHETTLQFVRDTGQQISISLRRVELEGLMRQHGLFSALQGVLEKVMGLAAQKGIYREDVQHVLLVGGTALIPSIQQTLDEYFRAITERKRKTIAQMPAWPALTWKIENTSIRVDKPFTAVVEGALQVAAGFHFDDQLAHGYGLRYLDATDTQHFDEVIPMGSVYPSKTSTRLTLGAAHADQDFIEFVIGQIDTEALLAAEGKSVDGQRAHGGQAVMREERIVLLNAGQPIRVKLSPRGQLGEARLLAEFRVDELRRLRLSVTDLRTRKKPLIDAVVTALGSGDGDESLSVKETSGYEPRLVREERNPLQRFVQRFARLFRYAAREQVSVEAFLADLRSEDALIRFSAAETLARRGDRDSRLAFEDIIQTGTPHQRASAVRHLHRFSWFAAEQLFRKALTDDDSRVQEAAVFALCKMRSPEAYHLATEVLQDGSDAMYSSAVWSIYSHPDPAAVTVLALALRAQNPETRTLALEVLGATESAEAIPIVKSAMGDVDPEVQYAATLSWVELAHESCFAELAMWIGETRGWSRRWILRGFFHATNYMGIESGSSLDATLLIRALENALNDDLPQARLAAFLPLAWIRHPDADTALAAGFQQETDSDTKAHMLTAAVHLMSPVAEVLLVAAQDSADQLVQQTAAFLRLK